MYGFLDKCIFDVSEHESYLHGYNVTPELQEVREESNTLNYLGPIINASRSYGSGHALTLT